MEWGERERGGMEEVEEKKVRSCRELGDN